MNQKKRERENIKVKMKTKGHGAWVSGEKKNNIPKLRQSVVIAH